MVPFSILVLHAGSGVEVTLLEYLYRVLLYLLAFGAIAVLAYWGSEAATVLRSASIARRDADERER